MSNSTRRFRLRHLASLLLVIPLLAEPSSAQQRAPASPLNLHLALELADKQNLDLAAARQQRALSEAGIRIAKQRPNPTFSVTELRDDPHFGFWFDHPIELGGKRQHRIEVAQQEGQLTEVQISMVARQVRRSTRDAYYQLALARGETARLEEVVKLAQRLKEIAEQRFEAGDVAQLEVLQAGLEVARAQADLQVARQREKVSLSQLNALLNEPATTPWELSGSLTDPLPDVTLAGLIQEAYASNFDLRRLAQEQNVEQSRLGLVKANRIPDLTLEYGLDFNSPHNFDVGHRAQISLLLPLINQSRGEIAQSLASQRVLEAEAVATKRAVAAQVETAYFDLNAQRSQVDAYRQTLVPAARRLESMAEESYRAGKTSILAVIDAQRNVQDVERNYQQSLLALQQAFAGLEQTVGASLE
jgi:cobalt-zinc-cadmium efflux system outer membrane protein